MRLVLIALALSFLQAAPPVPMKTDNSGKNSKAHQNKSSLDKQEPQPAEEGQKPGQKLTSQDENKPVVVRVLPVDLHKDRADYLYIGASILIALVTFVIASLAWKQASAAKISADAAKASADAVINSERAWLLVEKPGPEYLVPIEIQQQRQNAVFVDCKNFGKTVAKMTAWKFVLQITERSDGPDAGNAYDLTGLSFNPSIIPQADPMPQVAILQSNGGFITQRQLDDIITNATKFLWLCGIIKYEDVFRPGFEHETKFCYLYGTWIAGREPFFRLAGPPECNKAT